MFFPDLCHFLKPRLPYLCHYYFEKNLNKYSQEILYYISSNNLKIYPYLQYHYFEQIKMVLTARSDALEEIDFIKPAGAESGEWVGTNFERKYIKDQRPIYTIAARKT